MLAAIDPRACAREPLACAAIQRVLETEPTLSYDTTTGRFRHAYSLTPPLPPPPPSPPPRLVQYNIASPLPPPPPPASPPPWYERYEQCVVRSPPLAHFIHSLLVCSLPPMRHTNTHTHCASSAFPILAHAHDTCMVTWHTLLAPGAEPGLTATVFLSAQPTITPAEAGIDTSLTQTDEERALCLYVRALTDERVPATRCFSTLSPFPPPPPPTPQSTLAAIQTSLRRAKLRRGGTSGADPAPPRTDEDEYIKQHIEQNRAVNALLDRLSTENFQLRDVLEEIRPKLSEITATSGRRLFERLAGTGTHSLEQSIKTSELSVGNGALLGLTIAQCSTLCTALKNETASLHSCNGIMYRLFDAESASNLETAYCYLLKVRCLAFITHPTCILPSLRPLTDTHNLPFLSFSDARLNCGALFCAQNTGGCQPMDFAASIFSRRDTSGCRTPNSRDNPACVQLAPDRADMRILDFAAAKSSCRQGKGKPQLPRPRSSLEVRCHACRTMHHCSISHAHIPSIDVLFGRPFRWLATRASAACTRSGRRSPSPTPTASSRTGLDSTANRSTTPETTTSAAY